MSLDLKQVAGINVRVGLLDKIVKPFTGSLSILSPALHSSNGENKSSSFTFNYVEEPYLLNKEINEYLKNEETNNYE